MPKRSIVLAGILAILVIAATSAVRALGGTVAPWQASGSPTLANTIEMPANVFPSATNFDCTKTTVKSYLNPGLTEDCMVTVPLGQVGANGVVFNGSSESIPVVPASPFYDLEPIPNQSMLMTYVTAPTVGSYLFFYTSIRDKMSSLPQYVNDRWQYTVTGRPDITFRDSSGKAAAINRYTMAFSPNGSWMVVDLPWQGFVRINLATFEMQPFAQSLQQGNDYSDQRAQISITNDGRQVVVKPNNYDQFKVYDLTSCTGTSLPVNPGTERCASRDYWSYVNNQIPGFRGLYQPRFINNSQITFSAVHDYAPGNFKVASYTMTSPGESGAGIQYLGMGDSFASGEGAYAYLDGTDTANNRCHLSTKSYPFLFSGQLFSSGHSVSCSGAAMNDISDNSMQYKGQVKDNTEKNKRSKVFLDSVVANFTPGFLAQSEFLDTYKPQSVSLSIGGNDIGFSDIIKSCVSPVTIQFSCYSTYEDQLELYRQASGIFDRLVSTYKTVFKPGKSVYVIGYPQIAAPGGNCALNVHLDDHEIQMSADLINYLNLVVSQAAAKAGVRYVDVSHAFDGHRVCEAASNQVAVNGFTAGTDGGVGPVKFVGTESYHPNALGHDLLASTIRSQTNNFQAVMPPANPALQSPAIPSSLDGRNLPKSGRPTNAVIADGSMVPDILLKGQSANVTLDPTKSTLRASSNYKIVMHSDPVELGTAATDTSGNLAAITIQIPASTLPGFHTIHVYGPDMLGQPLDITKTIYVAASSDDYNGDSVPNSTDPCVFLPSSGQDVDKDGIDDACDGFVTALPTPTPSYRQISSSVTLTGNSITITRSPP